MEKISRRCFVKSLGGTIMLASLGVLTSCKSPEVPTKKSLKRKLPNLTKVENINDFFDQLFFVQEMDAAKAIRILSKNRNINGFSCLGKYNCANLDDVVFAKITSKDDYLDDNTSVRLYSINQIYKIYGAVDLNDLYVIDEDFYKIFGRASHISEESISDIDYSKLKLKKDDIFPL